MVPEPSEKEFLEEIVLQPPSMDHYQPLQTSQTEFLNLASFKPPNYHLLQQQPPFQQQSQQQQHQQILYSQQQVYLPQLAQPQQLGQVNEEDEGRATPVLDELPVSVSPSPSVKEYMTGSKDASDNKSHESKLEDFLSSLTRSSEKYASSRRHKGDKKRDSSPKKSSRKSEYKDEGSRRSRERSYEDRRSREGRQGNKEKSHRGKSREKRHGEKEYLVSNESSKYSKSRRRSRERSPSGECHSSGTKVKKSSSHYSPLSSKRSKTKERSPHKRKRSGSGSPPLRLSVSSSSATAPKFGDKYLKSISGSEIVMDGIYQAVERADGFSEIYRMPSDIDPSQYTYEEVVYVFTEEEDGGVSQLKQLNQNVSAAPSTSIFSSGIQFLTSSSTSIFSNSQFAGTFPVGSSLKTHAVSGAGSSVIQQVPNTMSLTGPQQQLIPANVLSGLVQQPRVQPQILAPGQVPVQIPPPPLPQPSYSFVQQPPPPLPPSVMPPPIVPPPPLMVNQLKNSTSQTPSLLDVSLMVKLPMSTSSFQGISKVLPSPSQFCQGIGATALLQRRFDENMLERSRPSQSQSGKQQVTSSTRRTSNLTTIQLTDDVFTSEVKSSDAQPVHSLMSSSYHSTRNETIETDNKTSSGFNTVVSKSMGHLTEEVNESDRLPTECAVHEKTEGSHAESVIFADASVHPLVDVSNDQLPDSSSAELLPRLGSATDNLELSQEPDSTRGGDDEYISDDDDSSDLDELQSSVTFTAPLSVAGHSTLSYAHSRGKDTRNQPGLLRRPTNDDGRNFLPRVINNNRIRPLLPNALLPTRVAPMFPINQYQQFGNINVISATGFDPLRFSHVPRLPMRLPINMRLPMQLSRIHFPGNPRF